MTKQIELFAVGKREPRPVSSCTPAAIGTGPQGETCRSCKFKVRVGRYLKCEKMERLWTHGAATDIKARWRACWYWEGSE